ncbi:MAG: gliding motility associated protein GldN [Fluviicola sp.]|uniref:type IX secretion system ring protein PorN/GldN n=1 Tax=Fluviicola sp. TaxID=1917219 RepID=UPI002601B522|nr:gliding motility protein GldN [Fluviicola sp.]MDF3028536.1 gliding motility associated protein GldN [Fluviicola sp.]
MKKYTFILILAASCDLNAQCESTDFISSTPILDYPYIKEHVLTKRTISYEYVREADVVWSKRVWREIDLREKINHPLYYPFDHHTPSGQYVRNTNCWSLWTIMRHHIMQGDLKIFSPYNPYQFDVLDGDQFKYPIVSKSGGNYCNDSVFRNEVFYYLGKLGPATDVVISTYDGRDSTRWVNGVEEYVYADRDTAWIDSEHIVKYLIKEDWFFDKERSVMDVRIMGIAPVVLKEETAPNGQKMISGMETKFWVYFPHLRYLLTNYYVYNEKNDAQWMSFDDLFWKRRFSSTVYKESNVFDRSIDSYRTGVDALQESADIIESIRTFEQDVWNF